MKKQSVQGWKEKKMHIILKSFLICTPNVFRMNGLEVIRIRIKTGYQNIQYIEDIFLLRESVAELEKLIKKLKKIVLILIQR